jgi:hypothetical protein
MRVKQIDILMICVIAVSAIVLGFYKAYWSMGTKPAGPSAAAIGKVRTIYTSEMQFYEHHKRYGSLSEIAEGERYSDPVFTKGLDNDYRYEVRLNDNQFAVLATPITYNSETNRSFYISSAEGKVRGADKQGTDANANDPAID